MEKFINAHEPFMFSSLKPFLKLKTPKFWGFLTTLRYPRYSVPFKLRLVNFIFQRIFRINSSVPWMVHFTSTVTRADNIKIGQGVWVYVASSGGCYIQGINGIRIGNDTIFAPGVKIISANHNPKDLRTWLPAEPIEIGDECWIGANAVVLPGVKLGDRCVVAAGAVVTKSFPSDTVLGGVPAKRML